MKYLSCLGCQADWAQLPRALPRHVARRREHRHRRGGRDSQVTEELLKTFVFSICNFASNFLLLQVLERVQ